MQGVITDGWPYVWSVYGITWTTLTLYAVSLWWRGRSKEP